MNYISIDSFQKPDYISKSKNNKENLNFVKSDDESYNSEICMPFENIVCESLNENSECETSDDELITKSTKYLNYTKRIIDNYLNLNQALKIEYEINEIDDKFFEITELDDKFNKIDDKINKKNN